MNAVTSYNANDCVIDWGAMSITGLAEDMVTGEKDEENFETQVGAQGDVVVNEKNNNLGTVTVTIQHTSPQRDQLIKDAKNGVIQPLWVTNSKLGEKFGGDKARIKKTPSMELGAEAGDLEIEFQVFDYDTTTA
jgi:hypothetical protein